MANKTATIRVTQTYIGPSNETVNPPSLATAAPYMAQSVGTIDVPDQEAGSTAHSIPVGSIGTEVTAFVIKNRTGQDLTLKINGSLALNTLPDGTVLAYAQPAGGATTKITALSLTTTGTQDGAGTIEYRLFGDPT